jgi:hypothetical protein
VNTATNTTTMPRRAGRPRSSETAYPCDHPRTDENTVGGGCRTCKRAINARYYQKRTAPAESPAPVVPGVSPRVAQLIEECRPLYLAAIERDPLQLDLLFSRSAPRAAEG